MVARQRLEVEVPARDGSAHVLLLVLSDQAGADVVDVDPLPVELTWAGGDVIPDVLQELANEDLVRLEMDTPAVAEAEVDRGTAARGLGRHRVEQAPVAEDLVEPLRLPAVARVSVAVQAALEVVGGPVELAAILEEGCQRIE